MKKLIATILACHLCSTAGVCFAQPVVAGPWVTRQEMMDAIADFYQKEFGRIKAPTLLKNVKITGQIRAAVGIDTHGDATFTEANPDLNERNWRLLSNSALNRGQNSYDPALYNRIKLVVDASVVDAVAVHLNLTVDPWSYTGKSEKTTVTGSWGNDTADIQYLTAGNTNYTLGRIVDTNLLGDSFALPEIKIKDGVVPATQVLGGWGPWNDQFNIPALKMKYTFQPIRELWVDLKAANEGKVRIFPMAYQNQALTTDDPLRLSNNMQWWESSPWINDWNPGHVDPNLTPVAYYKGAWDKSLAFGVRDSDGTRLTALRGVSADLKPTDDLSIKAVVATPKTLWQDYSEVTAVPASVRIKQFLGERMFVGSTGNMHLGMVRGKIDRSNYVGSVDTAMVPLQGVKLSAQASRSISEKDWLNSVYRTKDSGNAYFVSLEAITDALDPLKTDYLAQKAKSGADSFFKTRVYFARMDDNFESTLSNYHETRDDAYWSRHLTFYPSPYRKLPGIPGPGLGEADVGAFEVGNGIDYGRNVIGWRGNATLADGKIDGMADVRHVSTNARKKIEDVARTVWNYKPTEKLTTKAMGVWHSLPKTTAGFDPFIVDSNTGEPLINDAQKGGKDASLKTGALGARYELTEWAAINGVWEHTNDMTLGTDNFPRGIFSSGGSSGQLLEHGRYYQQPIGWLYNQGIFPQAPYVYHNIFKAGLHLKPTAIWDVYIDYTRNPNKFAGQIDDNMQHIGLESSLAFNKRFGVYGRYTFSQGYDLNKINSATPQLDYRSYHNVYLEGRYVAPKQNIFSLSYGVGPAFVINTSSTSPLLGVYLIPTLTTEHIVRMTYEKKF